MYHPYTLGFLYRRFKWKEIYLYSLKYDDLVSAPLTPPVKSGLFIIEAGGLLMGENAAILWNLQQVIACLRHL